MRRFVSGALVLGAVGAVFGAALFAEYRGWFSSVEAEGPPVTGPLRIGIASPESYEQLLLALRIHHYRPQPREQARFRDVLYDTPRWALSERGYSYRFRTRLEGAGGSRFSLRLEQEPRFVPAGSPRLDSKVDLPDELGAAIEAGAWERGVLEPAVEPAEQLRALLRELALDPSEVAPRLVAELDRERLEVSDKGQDWFELDHEAWTFRPLDRAGSAPAVAFEDVVIEKRLGGEDWELYRRARTMRQLVRMIDGIQPLERAPHERAIEALAGARDSIPGQSDSDSPDRSSSAGQSPQGR